MQRAVVGGAVVGGLMAGVVVVSYAIGKLSVRASKRWAGCPRGGGLRVVRVDKSQFAGSEFAREAEVAADLAVEAAQEIRVALNQAKSMEEKGVGDLVTETDKANEQRIFEGLRGVFPDHAFIGEEGSVEGIPALDDRPTWIVDPVDGTANFFHGLPFCCVSIALVVNKHVVVAAVCNGSTGEMFESVRGCGAWCDGEQIFSHRSWSLKDGVVVSEWGSQRDDDLDRIAQADMAMMRQGQVHGIRHLGSGVLDICYVAAGRLCGLYCGVGGKGWCPWDYAAGSLIAEEAGCTVLSANGAPFDLYGSSLLVACNASVASEMVALIKPHFKER